MWYNFKLWCSQFQPTITLILLSRIKPVANIELISRTYTHTSEKKVELCIDDLNKITYSYTAQYSLTKSGILLDKVFVCLQESGDTFGVRVIEEVDEL